MGMGYSFISLEYIENVTWDIMLEIWVETLEDTQLQTEKLGFNLVNKQSLTFLRS